MTGAAGTGSAERGPSAAAWRGPVEAGLVAVALYGLAAAAAGGLGFVNYDDPEVVFRNPVSSPGTLHRAFTETMAHAWLPLYALSLGVDGILFGTADATGFHLHSFLLHGVNAALVSLLAFRLGGSRRTALLAGLIFAVHPAVSESVAWVSSRKDLLSFTLAAGAAAVFLRAEDRGRWTLHGWGAALLGLALLAKGTVVVLPLLLALAVLARAADGAARRRGLRAVVPYAAVALAGTLLHLAVAAREGTVSGDPVPGTTAATLAWSGARALALYAMTLGAPVALSVEHGLDSAAGFDLAAAAGLVLAAGAVVLAVGVARGRVSPAGALALAVVAALLPFNGVFPRTDVVFAERYLYVAAAPAAALAALWLGHVPGGGGRALAATAVAALGTLTFLRTADWKDSESLWRSAVERAPASALARGKLGEALMERALASADPAERRALFGAAAEEHRLAAATALRPPLRFRALQDRGLALLGTDDAAAALEALDGARALLAPAGPVDGPGLGASLEVNRALALERLGREEEAVRALEAAVAEDPSAAAAWHNLGALRARAGDGEGAREAQRRALAADPGFLGARLAMADLELLAGDFAAALREAARAVEVSRGDPEALVKAAEIAALLGRPVQAEEWYRRACAAAPRLPAAREGLARALSQRSRAALMQGKGADAVRAAREAVRVDPAGPGPRFCLGDALRGAGDGEGAAAAYREALERGGGDAARDACASLHLAKARAAAVAGSVDAARRAVEAALAEGPRVLHLGGAGPRVEVGFDRIPPAGEAPEEVRGPLLDGLLSLVAGEHGAAIASLSTAIGGGRGTVAPDPAGPGGAVEAALLLRSRARSLVPDPEGAAADLEELTRRIPRDARAWFHLGQALTVRAAQRRADGHADGAAGDDGAAAAALEKARSMDPSLVEASIALAELHFTAGRPVDAIREVNGVLAAAPDRVEAHLVLGDIMKAQGAQGPDGSGLSDAEAAYRRALALEPGAARALAGLGEVAALGGRNRDALTYVLRALALEPSLPQARSLAALLFLRGGRARIEQRDGAGALDAATRAESLGGETPALCLVRADAHRLLGDWAASHREVERARSLAPADPEVRDALAAHYRDVGYALLLHGRRAEADEAFRRALAADGPSVDLSQVRLVLERGVAPPEVPAGADPAMGAALDRLVAAARERFDRGAEALKAGDPTGAAERFRESLAQYETAHGRFALGVALEAAGERGAAEEAYGRALTLDGAFADASLNLGGLLYRRGAKKEAAEAYRSYLRNLPRARAGDGATVAKVRSLLEALEGADAGEGGR